MITLSDIEKLERFANGLSTEEEKQYIYSLFAEHEGDHGLKHYLQQQFDEYIKTAPDEDFQLTYLLDRVHHIIHKKEKTSEKSLVRKIYKWYAAAAAILIVPLLIASIVWITEMNADTSVVAEAPVSSTLYAPLGSRINFSLPDGTKGWLNSGSSLDYTIPFSQNRKITVEGEVWLDIAHDEAHPFEIAAGKSKVKVLGTKFNLNAYPDENFVEVVLAEGKVEFSTSGLAKPVELKPNERLVYNNDGVNVQKTDASKFAAWVEGKLVFRGDPMTEVARRIGRWYNVDVVLNDKELEQYVIRGIFQDDTLEEVMRYLSMTSPIRYRIVDRKVLDDGTVQKRKVLLSRK
jgi:ferric-dicitrate binding protein FerR (iron transport regulator)